MPRQTRIFLSSDLKNIFSILIEQVFVGILAPWYSPTIVSANFVILVFAGRSITMFRESLIALLTILSRAG